MSLDVHFWQDRYDAGDTPWDLGQPALLFQKLLEAPPVFLKPGRMAVLGAGRGHDAALFARAGFEVVAFDYAPGAIEEASRIYADLLATGALTLVHADIFELSRPEAGWHGQFDYVLEHTCFCAIFPHDRARYAQSVQALLKPGGYLIGIFWEHGETDGPPFSTSKTAVQEIFNPQTFEIVSVTDAPAAAHRSGTERLIILRRQVPQTV